jgi:hypothetical protein
MKLLLGLCALAFSVVLAWQAAADQYVHGYTRSNGTYVQPYHRRRLIPLSQVGQ